MGILDENAAGVKAMQMAIQIPQSIDDTPIPLFQLEAGVASSSAGILCAKMAGVKPSVIERSEEIVQAMRGRRQVQPLAEILRRNLDFSRATRETLHQFMSYDWSKAQDDDLERFMEKVQHV